MVHEQDDEQLTTDMKMTAGTVSSPAKGGIEVADRRAEHDGEGDVPDPGGKPVPPARDEPYEPAEPLFGIRDDTAEVRAGER